MYLYLLHSKDETLDAFDVFKATIELQCEKQLKIVRSNRGGEYNGRYTMGLLPNILCLVLRIIMVWQKEEIEL